MKRSGATLPSVKLYTAIPLPVLGGFVAAGILQPLVGWVLDLSAPGDYRAALIVLAFFTSIGLAGALFIRETRCRNIWNLSGEVS